MAIFVVAVGAVLALLSCWAIYFGYSIVQVERGWAVLIAGAAVFSGGVVTAALGLVLHRLSSIHATLRQPQAVPHPSSVTFAQSEPSLPLPIPSTEPAAPQLDFGFPHPALAEMQSPVVADAVHVARHDPSPVQIDPLHIEPSYAAASPSDQVEHDVVPDAQHEPLPTDLHDDHAAVTPLHAEAVETAKPEALNQEAIENMWRVVGEELSNTDWARELETERHASSAPVHQEHPVAHAETSAHDESAVQAPHDEPVHEMAAVADADAPVPHPTAHEPVPELMEELPTHDVHHMHDDAMQDAPSAHHAVVDAGPEDDYRDLLAPPPAPVGHLPPVHEPEPAPEHAPEPEAKPQAPAVEAHVIGRYEADGTAYTMYSDGSIDAHAPDGLYHFGSMAELKAFIEQTPA